MATHQAQAVAQQRGCERGAAGRQQGAWYRSSPGARTRRAAHRRRLEERDWEAQYLECARRHVVVTPPPFRQRPGVSGQSTPLSHNEEGGYERPERTQKLEHRHQHRYQRFPRWYGPRPTLMSTKHDEYPKALRTRVPENSSTHCSAVAASSARSARSERIRNNDLRAAV
jgi:hypothetical protein